MLQRMTWIASVVLAGSTAWAQDSRVEISGNVGYTLSDGVSGTGVLAGDGNIYDAIEPKDSVSFNFTLGFFVNENVEVEGLYSQQSSTLEVSGTSTVEVGDMSVSNLHANFVYNFGETDVAVRPYLSLGLGATRFGSVSFTGLGGVAREIEGNSKFSGTLGAGLKIYPNAGRFGLKLGARWTPTYVKSDAVGYWCDPYWGCYVIEDAQYANQFEFSGGLTMRF